jgi:hypothetical protein
MPRGQATSASLIWNAKGSAVLVLTATDVDATNQSYYGEQKLSFLAADGRNDCIVPLKARAAQRKIKQKRREEEKEASPGRLLAGMLDSISSLLRLGPCPRPCGCLQHGLQAACRTALRAPDCTHFKSGVVLRAA